MSGMRRRSFAQDARRRPSQPNWKKRCAASNALSRVAPAEMTKLSCAGIAVRVYCSRCRCRSLGKRCKVLNPATLHHKSLDELVRSGPADLGKATADAYSGIHLGTALNRPETNPIWYTRNKPKA